MKTYEKTIFLLRWNWNTHYPWKWSFISLLEYWRKYFKTFSCLQGFLNMLFALHFHEDFLLDVEAHLTQPCNNINPHHEKIESEKMSALAKYWWILGFAKTTTASAMNEMRKKINYNIYLKFSFILIIPSETEKWWLRLYFVFFFSFYKIHSFPTKRLIKSHLSFIRTYIYIYIYIHIHYTTVFCHCLH